MAAIDRLEGVRTAQAIKTPVDAATTANITLEGEQTIDDIAVVSGDRVLVKDQTDATENGIYDVGTGAWARAKDFNSTSEITTGTKVRVNEGTINGNQDWSLTTDDPVIGTSALAFGVIATGASGFGATLVNAADAAAARTLLGVAAQGEFGIGGTAAEATSLDDLDESGVYRFEAADTGKPGASNSEGVCWHAKWSATSYLQIAATFAPAANDNQVFVRTGDGTTWDAWQIIGESAGLFKGNNGETGDTATGAGDIFRAHAKTLDTDTTIDADENALAAGPLTVANGITLTVTAGGSLSIV